MFGKKKQDASPIDNLHDVSVLIVDDSQEDAQIGARALNRFGINEVFRAETAEEAISFFEQRTCNLALIDYNLPGMNGVALLQKIRELQPHLPVVMVTGARDEKVAVDAMKLGAADYVTKDDFLSSGIVRSVQAALKNRARVESTDQAQTLAERPDVWRVASEEAEWLIRSFGAAHLFPTGIGDEEDTPNILVDDTTLIRPAVAGAGLQEMFEDTQSLLRNSFHSFPDIAADEESSLVRKCVQRGTSPGELLSYYRASLKGLQAEGIEPPFDPIVVIARVLGLLILEYQRQLSGY